MLKPDRLFPTDVATRRIARALYDGVRDLPIISPHGHTDPQWFAQNAPFSDPAALFVMPDHYVFRMLQSQGIALGDLGVARADGAPPQADPHKVWRLFAANYHLFRATPSQMWLDHAFEVVFGVRDKLSAATADAIYDHIAERLQHEDFRPRALFERFNIEALSTTESALDDLHWHRMIAQSGWSGRVITTYRPDAVIDPEFEGFADNLRRFGALTGEDTATYGGYLAAHRKRRAYFKQVGGATASDHGHPTARTEDLSVTDATALFDKVRTGSFSPEDADCFRGHMLTQMARMSVEDGLVMQIHAGSVRNHSSGIMRDFGRDKGYDIPARTDYVNALRPLLNAVGGRSDLCVIAFTLDESSYARELAPLAGVYPALRLGPPWWFHDSYEGMMRFRKMTTETAGFYNTVGFNDDTRAFCSIPARHDVARRVDCAYLAELVATGRLEEEDAAQVAYDLSYRLAKQAYRL